MNTFCVIDSVRKSGRPPPSTRTTRVKGRRSTARGPLGFLFRNAVRWPLGFFRKGSVGVVDFLPSLFTVRGETWYVHVSLTARARNWLRYLVVHCSVRDCVVFRCGFWRVAIQLPPTRVAAGLPFWLRAPDGDEECQHLPRSWVDLASDE